MRLVFKKIILNIFFLSIMFINIKSETLVVKDSIIVNKNMIDDNSYEDTLKPYLFISGANYVDNKYILSTSVGVLIKKPLTKQWQLIAPLETAKKNWLENDKIAIQSNSFFSPGYIWQLPQKNKIAIFDNRISSFYTVNLQNHSTKIWKKESDKLYINSGCISGDIIIYGTYGAFGDTLLNAVDEGNDNVRKFYVCPPKLFQTIDSLGGHLFCLPAFNPYDSSTWLAFRYYDKIYKIDFQGTLLDSLQIKDSDYKRPQPPISKLQTNAVFQDWISKLTMVESIWLVAPEYIVLQFDISGQEYKNGFLRQYKTIVWNTEKQIIELEINKHWKLVGTQPNGNMLFSSYLITDSTITDNIIRTVKIKK